MKSITNKRLKKLENELKSIKRHKSALVVCDPKIHHTFDCSHIEADTVLLLPDNGRRTGGKEIPSGSFIVRYSS